MWVYDTGLHKPFSLHSTLFRHINLRNHQEQVWREGVGAVWWLPIRKDSSQGVLRRRGKEEFDDMGVSNKWCSFIHASGLELDSTRSLMFTEPQCLWDHDDLRTITFLGPRVPQNQGVAWNMMSSDLKVFPANRLFWHVCCFQSGVRLHLKHKPAKEEDTKEASYFP